MAIFASSATTCGARKHAWTNYLLHIKTKTCSSNIKTSLFSKKKHLSIEQNLNIRSSFHLGTSSTLVDGLRETCHCSHQDQVAFSLVKV